MPNLNVGFEDLAVAVMKGSIFRDITPCESVDTQETFQTNISPPSSGAKISQTRNKEHHL
jgi:hypothetical protein